MPPTPTLSLGEQFYEAALDGDLWDAALQGYAEAFGGIGTVILQPGLASPILSVTSGVQDAARQYNEFWWREDLVLTIAQRLGLDRPGICWDDDFISSDTKAKSFYFQDFLRRQDIGGVATIVVEQNGTHLAINVQRRFGLAPPDAPERQRFADVSRHLSRALALRLRLDQAEAVQGTLARRLGDFDCAVVVTDRVGRVVESNAAFAALAPDGLTIREGRVHLATGGMQRQFDAVLRAVTGGEMVSGLPDTLVVPRPGSLLPLLLRITPLVGRAAERFTDFTPTHGALILVLNPTHSAYPDLSKVLIALGLTYAQARVALLIAAGHGVKAAAEALSVSEETVRTHLKGVYARLGLSRQADLVRLVAKAVPFGT
ncbi:helix-turn-helix transcriptional regulator [Aureimonas sp. AU20]|uniref:helix-turn-helix transcriptional regulator n=1 Tax=Aureimonas sp. AU20 TaxID=1349819 RepID=UPI00071FE930|nr:helix-turn-helix transcriptional regulator [Aureimonas sp. AU20]ALN73480.1 hypothetical protein M673_12210 [Aureimonas sp. AU20]